MTTSSTSGGGVPGLPVDPDLAGTGERPAHRQRGLIALVLAGGMVGAPVRYLVSQRWVTPTDHFPWSTFAINAVGSFLLGALLEALFRAGPDTGTRRRLRLLVGTGALGAFTTYSTLAVEADLLVHAHADTLAAADAVASVAAGLLACLVGITVAGLARNRTTRHPPRPSDPDSRPTAHRDVDPKSDDHEAAR